MNCAEKWQRGRLVTAKAKKKKPELVIWELAKKQNIQKLKAKLRRKLGKMLKKSCLRNVGVKLEEDVDVEDTTDIKEEKAQE